VGTAGDAVVTARDAVISFGRASISRALSRVNRSDRSRAATAAPARGQRLAMAGQLALARAAILEWLLFDARMARAAIAAGLSIAAFAAWVGGRFRRAIDLVMTLDRGAFPGPLPLVLRRALAADQPDDSAWLRRARIRVISHCREQMIALQPQPQTARFYSQPDALLGPLVMVLKTATGGEKGVLVLLYSHVLPLFGRLFDLEQVLRRYHLVLEPSWSGYCNADVLCYRGFDDVVFVQAYEPRDRELIDSLTSNLVSVPTSNNWWVDHRVFVPISRATRDIDVIMIAGWAPYKRHARFFAGLRTLRRRGTRLRVALVGYSLGMSLADLQSLAAHFDVDDQIEWHEGLTQPEVNVLLNRSKVNVIWSRKEGVNRAIVEGMFAGVPCVVRAGFNYGHRYPYINEATGRFADESELPDCLAWMTDNYQRFDPRPWVMEHMSCQRSTAIVEDAVRGHAEGPWSGPLAVKVNGLHGMHYWDDADATRFAEDYRFLRSAIKPDSGSRVVVS
jgi:glycosyltransferase involved in cell wall biosynthesis